MRETYGTHASAGLREVRRTLPSRPADARRTVRQAVAERCGARAVPCDDTALEDALLVTSELTTNAILHGGGITGFDVDVDPGTVSVTVCDRSTTSRSSTTPWTNADDPGSAAVAGP